MQRNLDSMEKLDSEQSQELHTAGVQAALEKLKHHPESEAAFMMMGRSTQPACNLQSAVDASCSELFSAVFTLAGTKHMHSYRSYLCYQPAFF